MHKIYSKKQGFIALIAVLLLSIGTVVFSMMTTETAFEYADSIFKKELRIQTRLNANACIDTSAIILSKNYLTNGTTTVSELGCDATFTHDAGLNVFSLNVRATLQGITVYGKATMIRLGKIIQVISREVM